MEINRFIVAKNPSYHQNKDGYTAEIEVKGDSSFQPSIKIAVPPEALVEVLTIIQAFTVKAFDAANRQFAEEIASRIAGPVVEAEALTAPEVGQ